ncbi:MAG: serine/threonine-protein kinase [Planctomycetota bacterium]|jgi:predicted Ser/Thr protein kinase
MTQTPHCRQCETPMESETPDGLCPACAAAPRSSAPARATIKSNPRHEVPTPEELGARFPQLDILEPLGQGGMGAVYKARQRGLDRLVALKILPPAAGDEPGFAERFTREARALAKLSHPNIVAVYDSGDADGLYYLIMEFVDGPNLRRVITADEAGSDQAMKIVGQMCDALQYAHEEGIVHRDIKPENVLLDRKGRVKIADFGLVKLLQADRVTDYALTHTQQVMGTPHYMAPEQTERPTDVDHRADIYSLGVVFYELLTGELPLGRFPLPSETGRADARLDEIVLRTLEKAPEKRFQQASEVRSAMDSVAGSGIPPGLTPSSLGVASTVGAGVVAARTGGPTPAAAMTSLTSLHGEVDFPRAYQRVHRSASFLSVVGVLSLVVHGIPAAVFLVLSLAGQETVSSSSANSWAMRGFAIGSAVAVLMMIGAQKMKRLEARPLCVSGCVLALLPVAGMCWMPLTLFAGFWALIVLNRRDITAAFELKAEEMLAAGLKPGRANWIVLGIAIGLLIVFARSCQA